MRAKTTLVCLLALACQRDPSVVFVPGDGFRESLEISTELGADPVIGVDEPLTLHARRTSGPWQEVPRTDLLRPGCWWAVPPDRVEPEVADNVTWRVRPDSVAAFNIGFRPDRTREVRFPTPGVYDLTAQSAVSCLGLATVDTLTIRVVND